MNDKKPMSIPYRRKEHQAYQHNLAHRLEGVVKNTGIKPVRKAKSAKKTLSEKLIKEAECYAHTQMQVPEPLL